MGVGHLSGTEFVWPSDVFSPPPGSGYTFLRAFDQILTFKLGERGHDGIDQFPVRRCGIHIERDDLKFNSSLRSFSTSSKASTVELRGFEPRTY